MHQSSIWTLGGRNLWRDLRAGELRLLVVAVLLAVAALSSVGFFADRLQAGLQRDARQLLGGDVVVVSDNPPPPVFAARASTRFNFPGKPGIMGLIMLPLVLPEIIIAMSLLVVLLAVGVKLSIFTVILGHTLICLPYTIAILSTSFNSLDKSLEEAAYDLGETKWSAFRLVILPLVMPGIISALLMSFTISLDEFIIAFFLAGNEPTLPTYIFSQLRFPKQTPTIMALGTVLVVMSIILLTVAEYYRRRGNARTGANNPGGFL